MKYNVNNIVTQRKELWIFTGIFLSSVLLFTLSALFSNLWFLLFFGLIPLFFCSERIGYIRLSLASLVVGSWYYFLAIYPLSTLNTWWWKTTSGFFWDNRELVFISISIFLAVICGFTTFFLTFFLYSKFFKEKKISIILIPAIWTGFEILRVKILFGLEWATFGEPLANNLFFARSSAVGGVFALTFFAVIINFILFLLLKNYFSKKSIKEFLLPLFVLIIVLGIIATENFYIARDKSFSKQVTVAVVRPDTKEISNLTNRSLELISSAVLKKPDLIVLPENSIPVLVINEEKYLPVNHDFSPEIKGIYEKFLLISKNNPETTLLIGLHTQKENSRFNSAVVFENGKIISIYNKKNLLPFTEKSFSFLKNVHIEPLEGGTGKQKLETQHGSFSLLICSEILVSKNKNEMGQILINLSNDSVFDSKEVSRHSELISKIKAIQNQKPIIRSAKGGFSGIFDQTGQKIPLESDSNGEILFGTVNIHY